MSASADTYLSELQLSVTHAGLNYEVWWVYKSEHTRPKFVDAMNRYSIFFQTSIHAHFVALLVALYRLYETRSKKHKTYSIPSFLHLLKTSNALDEPSLSELEAMYRDAKPLWRKVSTLRNKVFGHRSVECTVEEAFKEAGLSPNHIRDLIEKSKELLNRASRALNHSVHAFNLGAAEDVARLLKDISQRPQLGAQRYKRPEV